eukprot:TRINITY_DN1793_c0_g1_i13.p1 TRINITY_DN1793_c0_g1~~TRINITY_DN1793_c0_g1_i13.p1  ORF type:complete len:280 (+),score=74.39 TRINITY_DN1793_c0_g1_i13:87-842(+)
MCIRDRWYQRRVHGEYFPEHSLKTSSSPKTSKMDAEKRFAICVLNGNPTSGVTGVVKFIQEGDVTKISAVVKNLPAGKHGFHIHKFGDLSNGCTTAGPHFNPADKTHGGPQDEERHVGDLGNIEADGTKDAVYYLEDKLIRLDGPTSIIGRSIVVHADEDDLGRGNFPDSKQTGHAGARVACGVIGLADTLTLQNTICKTPKRQYCSFYIHEKGVSLELTYMHRASCPFLIKDMGYHSQVVLSCKVCIDLL